MKKVKAFLLIVAIGSHFSVFAQLSGDINSKLLKQKFHDDVHNFHKMWNHSNDFLFDIEITDNSFNDNFATIEEKNDSILYKISVSKRLAENEMKNGFLTRDTFAWVFCHELGHFLGGFPVIDHRIGSYGPTFLYPITVEAQADYYSSAVCLKKYFMGQDNKRATMKQLEVFNTKKFGYTNKIEKLCAKAFPNNDQEEKYWICLRSILSSLGYFSFSYIDFDLSKTSKPLHTEGLVLKEYPKDQCRIDTIINGALCETQENVSSLHTREESLGQGLHCKNRSLIGERSVRPNCWYNSQDNFLNFSKEDTNRSFYDFLNL